MNWNDNVNTQNGSKVKLAEFIKTTAGGSIFESVDMTGWDTTAGGSNIPGIFDRMDEACSSGKLIIFHGMKAGEYPISPYIPAIINDGATFYLFFNGDKFELTDADNIGKL